MYFKFLLLLQWFNLHFMLIGFPNGNFLKITNFYDSVYDCYVEVPPFRGWKWNADVHMLLESGEVIMRRMLD